MGHPLLGRWQAGYAASGGGFGNAERRLRSLGLITFEGGLFRPTEAGLAHAAGIEPVPTGAALVEYWMGTLNRRAEREVLRVLLEAWPSDLSLDEIAAAAVNEQGGPYEASGGGFGNAVRKLKRLLLVVATAGNRLRAVDELAGP